METETTAPPALNPAHLAAARRAYMDAPGGHYSTNRLSAAIQKYLSLEFPAIQPIAKPAPAPAGSGYTIERENDCFVARFKGVRIGSAFNIVEAGRLCDRHEEKAAQA